MATYLNHGGNVLVLFQSNFLNFLKDYENAHFEAVPGRGIERLTINTRHEDFVVYVSIEDKPANNMLVNQLDHWNKNFTNFINNVMANHNDRETYKSAISCMLKMVRSANQSYDY